MENERRFGNRFGGRGGGDRGGDRGSDHRGGGGFNKPFQPVKEGEELNAIIEAVAEKGDGIAKKSGFVIFVPGTKVGDKVKIRIKKVAKKVAFADVVGSYDESEAAASQASTDQETPAAVEQAEPEEDYDASQDSEEF